MSFFRFTFFLIIFFFISGAVLAQPNSVRLFDGNGILISSHSSITAAYDAIPPVISKAYVIEIMPGYNTTSEVFPIEIYSKAGTSSQTTITLRPAAGNYGVVISKALNNNPIINLNGVSCFILDGRPGGTGDSADLVIENTLNNGAKTNTINFINGASNNTVKYVVARSVPRSNAGPRNIAFSASNNKITSNNLIDNCVITGGRSGISFSGISSGLNSGNIVKDSKIYQFGLCGVWLVSNSENTSIINCEIYQEESGLNTSRVGGVLLNPAGANGINEISNNRIYGLMHNSLLDSAGVWGIYGSAASGAVLNIFNNFIALPYDNQNTNFTHGIYLNDSTQFTANIFYNTVRIAGTQSSGISEIHIPSSGITQANSNVSSVFNIYNNIFLNNRTGGLGYHVGGHFLNTEGILNADYNCYFSENSVYHSVWGEILFDTLTAYRSAAYPNEQNSIFKNVQFASLTDLHLTGSSNGDIELAGIPIAMNYDIDYDIRDPYYPYKGADEADALPVELSFFTASVSDNDVTLVWKTKTETNNSGFEVQRKGNDGIWIPVIFIKGNGTTTEETEYGFTDMDLNAGNYKYRLKQMDFGGSYEYYNLSESVEITNPVQYSLCQNYPNPFNPSTVIEYSIPETGLVELTIYSITGEKAAELVNSVQNAGNYKVSFNASSLASGMYFYSMKVNNYTSTKKMILIR